MSHATQIGWLLHKLPLWFKAGKINSTRHPNWVACLNGPCGAGKINSTRHPNWVARIKNINLAKCEALGYGVKLKGKLAIRTTVAIDFNGNILGFNMNPSNTHDSKIFNDLINKPNIIKKLQHTKVRNIIADKGYISKKSKLLLERYNINFITPVKSNESRINIRDDEILLEKRPLIERVFQRLTYQISRKFDSIHLKNMLYYRPPKLGGVESILPAPQGQLMCLFLQ